MKKHFYAAMLIGCAVALGGCGGENPKETPETSVPAAESSAPSAETPSPSTETLTEPDSTPPEDVQSSPPSTISAYFLAGEKLWKSDKEYGNDRTVFVSEAREELLSQRQELESGTDYEVTITDEENFAETGNFTLSLPLDDGSTYVLEGSMEQYSIFFGGACRLGDTIYLGTGVSSEPPYALDIETQVLRDCGEEYETLESIYSEYLQDHPENADLRIWYLQPVAQLEECTIYLASISEAMDTDTRAVIYAAFDENRFLRAYLLLTDD